ncbi:MBL fold metallo-hydrolase [Desulfofundulus thermobenzoicus]|uniref:MBL fold metallo-hydrolase n=1 Tax=Desulfofundulus thermobenzoicus TaxID=29376 RepID=A0A6N7ILA2_9FIRM|nr:N-acyl homoserine lactonase family protein [Desulfofundulus thermobenzoicus]MQL50756.1 MBL fold metallo-hydrolase [Desulfofundulus thermobenzoicus]HHW42601.1 N-acyl homoserine lactonase family protein [Desulfotomaculum sp.]
MKVIPLHLGSMTVDKSGLTSVRDAGIKIDIPVVAWLIEGGKERVLVDTGAGDPDWSRKYHNPMVRTEEQRIDRALELLGISPGEIRIIINTHLHWDHCFNNHLFENAVIYVQRKELAYAADPLPRDRRYYETDLGAPLYLKAPDNIKEIEGDVEIIPGVWAVHIPGHTPGMQGVAVETVSGTCFIASDAVGLWENWEADPPVPGQIYVDLRQVYRSFEKIRRLADFVLPGHDPRIFDKKCYPE